MLAKFGTNSGGISWWSNFELVQVKPRTIGQIWKQSGILFSWKDNSSYRLYTLGPLCLWQCFVIFSNATQFGWFPIMSLSIIVPELHEGCVFRFFCHMLSKQFGANLPERNSSVFTPFEIFTPSPSIWLFSPSPSIWRFVNTELNGRLESVRGNQID